MAEKPTPFVVNDRRKFTADGELRNDLERAKSDQRPQPDQISAKDTESVPHPHHAEPIAFPSHAADSEPSNEPHSGASAETIAFPGSSEVDDVAPEDELPPAPTAEQSEQATRAYDATVDRLDTAIRASNPGADRIPEMSFDRFVQSLYMQAILQLGGGAEPGQQAQVDIIGARQTIDMLAILAEKTSGNLKPNEDKLLKSALFEARMGFLEITQAIARQAAGRQPGGPAGPLGGPSIVR